MKSETFKSGSSALEQSSSKCFILQVFHPPSVSSIPLKSQAHEGCEGLHTGEVKHWQPWEEEFLAEKTEEGAGAVSGTGVAVWPC